MQDCSTCYFLKKTLEHVRDRGGSVLNWKQDKKHVLKLCFLYLFCYSNPCWAFTPQILDGLSLLRILHPKAQFIIFCITSKA